ncbi:MAG TPA: hypothetical protein VHD56_05965 [Tepidisphaeraceae bacterium]|nr:hypothetical protein [Tepidisphaeraceae bacterium]
MAEEAKKKPDAAPAAHAEKPADKKDAAAAPAKSKAGFLAKTPVLLGGVMILEAAVLLAGFKMLGGSKPQAAVGASLATEEEGAAAAPEHEAAPAPEHGAPAAEHGAAATSTKIDKKKSVEVPVIDFRAPNQKTGRKFLYDVTIFAVTKGEYKERVEGVLKERDALIKDRVRTIIAQSDPEKLGGGEEPGLETLRRQVKYQLDDIVGEGMIDEVLVPRCIPIRMD